MKEALAQTEQEPYCWTWDVWVSGGKWRAEYGWKKPTEKVVNLQPLYTAPPQRTWVGLTDDEVDQFHNWKDCTWSTNELVRHVEEILRSKNT